MQDKLEAQQQERTNIKRYYNAINGTLSKKDQARQRAAEAAKANNEDDQIEIEKVKLPKTRLEK